MLIVIQAHQHVKSELVQQFSNMIDSLFQSADASATPRALEEENWKVMLLGGACNLGVLLARLARPYRIFSPLMMLKANSPLPLAMVTRTRTYPSSLAHPQVETCGARISALQKELPGADQAWMFIPRESSAIAMNR